MSKYKMFSIFLVFLFFGATSSFAAQVDNSANPGTILEVDSGKTTLQLGFSPSVAGLYSIENADGDKQWYAISTYHQGGTLFYGTASDQTSVFKLDRENNQTFTDITVPQAPEFDENGNPKAWALPVAEGGTPPENDWRL